MMFCLLWQFRSLCGQQRPFILNAIPSNQKGELRANSNRMLGGTFVHLPWACCRSSESQATSIMTHHLHRLCLNCPARCQPLGPLAQLDGEDGRDP